MTIVSRLGSKPGRLLDSRVPSPGETRKLLLGLGMLNAPQVIVMDEPTNHLDIVSIEALQKALSDCPCALLLVSHDAALVEALDMQRWICAENSRGQILVTIES
jgi:ATPase subunit of ABC transporter with duplicated ATPase domains